MTEASSSPEDDLAALIRKEKEGKPVPVSPVAPPSPEKDRMTARVVLHHEQWGETPVSHTCSASRVLETKEQAYQRKFVLTAGKPMNFPRGHFADGGTPGMVLVESRVGKARQRNPTPAELEDERKRVVMLSREGVVIGYVRPGGFFCGELGDLSTVTLETPHGDVPLVITILPE
jgi:hypothetical protein